MRLQGVLHLINVIHSHHSSHCIEKGRGHRIYVIAAGNSYESFEKLQADVH